MPLEYIVPSLIIVVITEMTDVGAIEETLSQLVQLEEDRFVTGYHQRVKKKRHKAQHDHHIKLKQFQVGDFVLLYDNNFFKHLGKIRTHQMGPSIVICIIDGGVVQLQKLDGTPFKYKMLSQVSR